MSGNPNILPAPLNRLIASITWTSFTSLNITPPFLMPEAINIAFNGPITTNLPSLTSVVPSPEPYVPVSMTIHIIRTASLAGLYKTQMETASFLGQCTVRPDTTALGTYAFNNMSITRLSPISFSCHDAGFIIETSGTYNLNSSLFP
jgi:hypothetical protein